MKLVVEGLPNKLIADALEMGYQACVASYLRCIDEAF